VQARHQYRREFSSVDAHNEIVSPGQLDHVLKYKLKKQYYTECLMILEACNGNGTEAMHRIKDALKENEKGLVHS